MSLPFSKIRMVDLTRVWAGPAATRMFADLGAEVIKIEAIDARPVAPEGPFFDFNRNKVSVALNLGVKEGRDIFKKLVAVSDIVVENFSPRVMGNFGLEYAALRQINPRLIMMSMPGYGMDGPYRNYVAYGSTLEPQTGLSSLMGYPDAGPYKSGSSYTDPMAALHGVAALLMALWHRRRTGEGQFIEIAQSESATALIGEHIVGYGMTGELPKSPGNRHPHMAPHGCYPCRGEDRWLAISVGSEEEWRSLARVMGRPDLCADERFADELSRWHHQDELDGIIGGWTRTLDHREAMDLLQQAGVSAGAVLDAAEMATDPNLHERGSFWPTPHPTDGTFLYPGLPIRFSAVHPTLRMGPPLLGEHSESVLTDLLGMSKEDVDLLLANGVIGSPPRE